MLQYKPPDLIQLARVQPDALSEQDRVQPELRRRPIPSDVHMRWLVAVKAVEVEAVGAGYVRDCRQLVGLCVTVIA